MVVSENRVGVRAHETRQRLAAQIKALLQENRMSRQELSDYLGVDRAIVSKALDLRGRDFRAPEVHAMAVLFNVPTDYLFGEDVEKDWQERLHHARLRAARRVDDTRRRQRTL